MALPTFHPHDVNAFQREARRVIIAAGILGWTIRWANQRKGMVVLISEDGSKKINVPKTSLNQHRSEAMIRQIITHTSPEAITELFKGTDLTKDTDMADLLVWLARYLPTPTEKETPAVPIENQPLPFDAETPEPAKTDSPLVYEVVPYLVWYKDGRHLKEAMPSERVVQRNWSDGHVDYACSEVGCTYTSLSAAPVTSHNNFKHRRASFKRPAVAPKAKPATYDTDSRTLDKIRELVGVGTAARVAELEKALADANARADAAEGDLKALRDLLGKY